MVNLDIVVVNYKTDTLLKRFLSSVEEFYPSLVDRVLIYDVESNKNWDNWSFFSNPANCGYAYACNHGALLVANDLPQSEYIAFFNADTKFIDSQCIPLCLEVLSDKSVGAVGPMQVDSSGRVTHAGIGGTLRKPRHLGWKSLKPELHRKNRDVISVSGAAYFTKRSVWAEMTDCPIYQKLFPGVDGGFLPTPLYYEETGYSYHLIAHDYKIKYVGNALMLHEHDMSPAPYSVKVDFANQSRKIFRQFCDVHHIPHD